MEVCDNSSSLATSQKHSISVSTSQGRLSVFMWELVTICHIAFCYYIIKLQQLIGQLCFSRALFRGLSHHLSANALTFSSWKDGGLISKHTGTRCAVQGDILTVSDTN